MAEILGLGSAAFRTACDQHRLSREALRAPRPPPQPRDIRGQIEREYYEGGYAKFVETVIQGQPSSELRPADALAGDALLLRLFGPGAGVILHAGLSGLPPASASYSEEMCRRLEQQSGMCETPGKRRRLELPAPAPEPEQHRGFAFVGQR